MNYHIRNAVLTAVALVAHAFTAPCAHAQASPTIDVAERFTTAIPDVIDGPQYIWEQGTLFSNGVFVAAITSSSTCGTSTTSVKPTAPQVYAVSSWVLIPLHTWLSLEASTPGWFSTNFARSNETYILAGVQYIVVWSKSGTGQYSAPPAGVTSTGSPILGSGPRLINMSVRAQVSKNGTVIPGFAVADDGKGDKLKVIIRAVGPTLASFGVGGTLPDPKITVYDKDAKVVATNDDWGSTDKQALIDAFNKVGAFALSDGSKDAAVILTLAPGLYTAKITGAADTSGEVMLEVYSVD